MRGDFSTLFEPFLLKEVDWDSKLKLVVDGKRKIACAIYSREDVDNYGDFDELLMRAWDCGLVAVTQSSVLGTSIEVFFHRPQESWRVAAIVAIRRQLQREGWSDHLESLEQDILGLSESEIATHLRGKRHHRSGWIGQTVLLLVSLHERESIREMGFRCFPPTYNMTLATPFVSATTARLKSDPSKEIPIGLCLCRFAVDSHFYLQQFDFEDQNDPEVLVIGTHTVWSVSMTNGALRSGIEFWNGEAWLCS